MILDWYVGTEGVKGDRFNAEDWHSHDCISFWRRHTLGGRGGQLTLLIAA